MTIELREDGALIDSVKPGYYGCECGYGCSGGGGCNCTGDTPTPPGPEPPAPDTGITSIHIIVADTITDSGKASVVFLPSTARTSFYFSSSDESIAEIDPDTGEITVIQTGVVTFCVEDLYTGLEDCKEVNVIKSEDPDTGDTGTTDTRLKVIYYRRSGYAPDTDRLLTRSTGVTSAEFEDGTIIYNPAHNFCYEFDADGYHTVYYTLKSDELSDYMFDEVWGVYLVEIPSGVTRIGDYCFYRSSGKTVIRFPDTLVEVGDYAFYGNTGIEEMVLPEGVTSIGEECFRSALYLTALTIPSTVETIGNYFCLQCSRLENVTILCDISAYTGSNNPFSYCPSLVSFTGPNASSDQRMLVTDDGVAISFAPGGLTGYTTPEGVERIGSFCFATDDSSVAQIEEITISEGVLYIDGSAFMCLNNVLRRVNLPSTLLEMKEREVFAGRTNLSDIYCYAETMPVVGDHTFYSHSSHTLPSNGTLHYPEGSDYSSWLSNNAYFLGYYGWTGQEITG